MDHNTPEPIRSEKIEMLFAKNIRKSLNFHIFLSCFCALPARVCVVRASLGNQLVTFTKMAGSKKAVRAALRDEKRKRLAEEDGTVVEQSIEAEDNEEEGMSFVGPFLFAKN